MYKRMLLAVGSAALLAASAAAYAELAPAHIQLAQAPGGAPSTPGSSPGTRDSSPPSASPSAPGTMGAPAEKMEESPASLRGLEGKDVLNMEGDKIGQVEAIAGDTLIVSTGGFLGIGERKVALSRSNVNVTGAGDTMKVQTTMTRDQFKALPEYTGATTGTPSPSTPAR